MLNFAGDQAAQADEAQGRDDFRDNADGDPGEVSGEAEAGEEATGRAATDAQAAEPLDFGGFVGQVEPDENGRVVLDAGAAKQLLTELQYQRRQNGELTRQQKALQDRLLQTLERGAGPSNGGSTDRASDADDPLADLATEAPASESGDLSAQINEAIEAGNWTRFMELTERRTLQRLAPVLRKMQSTNDRRFDEFGRRIEPMMAGLTQQQARAAARAELEHVADIAGLDAKIDEAEIDAAIEGANPIYADLLDRHPEAAKRELASRALGRAFVEMRRAAGNRSNRGKSPGRRAPLRSVATAGTPDASGQPGKPGRRRVDANAVSGIDGW